jgi:general transcription factor 3C polypeptide 5 (transcription factor C subunit 1)
LAYNGYVLLKPTDATVPMGPKDTLPPESSLTPYLQTLINQIKALLKERPIITRHMLYNKLGWDKRTRLRQAAVYCGYFFESGPWREALVKWGVDPRTDPQYRIYQTVSFLSYKKRGTARHFTEFDKHVQQLSRMTTEQLENKHTFDGVHASDTGNTFQFCDITDPLIAKILATNDVRTTCAPTFQGWYHVGTWAKATVILKDKMNAIIGGERPDNSIYERVTKWPELWDDQEIYATYRDEVNDREVHQEKRKEHDVMHNVRFAARNPRYAFEKMEKNDEGGRQVGETEGPEVEEVPEDLTEYPETAATIINEGDGGDDDDDSSEDGDDDDEDEDVDAGEGEDEDRNELEDADGIWEEDDDQPIATETQTAGPAPFGGLYRM